ncbi:MAG: hypothetical protein CME88_13535 [Hirschia sp.]|nr:hypothetical protein [Hirschia sp.]MBF19393.1 hypothetical protein [Hirschia sp.]
MKFRILGAIACAAGVLVACQTAPQAVEEITVAEYCADTINIDDHVCQVKLELDGQSELLANTSLSLSQARAIADTAHAKAEEAARKAEEARRMAAQALLSQDDLVCKTQIIQKSKVGGCEPNYTLMSCSQTRYTTNAGGVSIMREINDNECRFQDRVLEIQVRCCRLATPEEKAANATSIEASLYSDTTGLYD